MLCDYAILDSVKVQAYDRFMTHSAIHLGRIFGIPLDVDRSWFIVLFLVTWLLAVDFYPTVLPGWSATTHWLMGLLTAFSLFVSVYLHELGHSVVALWFRVPVHGITLFLFGGVARLGAEPPSALAEFLIAIAGPLVSLLLSLLFFFLWPYAAFSQPLSELLGYLALINLTLFIFNLIPGYPLDGGRVLRAVIWKFTLDLRRATFISANVGRIFGGLIAAYGVWRLVSGNISGGIWVLLIGWFLYSMATQAALANRINANQT